MYDMAMSNQLQQLLGHPSLTSQNFRKEDGKDKCFQSDLVYDWDQSLDQSFILEMQQTSCILYSTNSISNLLWSLRKKG